MAHARNLFAGHATGTLETKPSLQIASQKIRDGFARRNRCFSLNRGVFAQLMGKNAESGVDDNRLISNFLIFFRIDPRVNASHPGR
jgi:hypothetical protein